MDGIDDQVDQHLLQFRPVHADETHGAILALDRYHRLFQQMLNQRQRIGNDLGGGIVLDEPGKFLRPGELQQFRHDFGDAMHLLVDQAELGLCLLRIRAHHVADDFEIALHDGDGIVDLMGDTGGDFADGRQLFGHDELPRRRLQPLRGVAEFQRALIRPLAQLLVPQSQFGIACLDAVQQPVQFTGHQPDLVAIFHRPGARGKIAGLDATDGPLHAFERPEDAARPEEEERDGRSDGEQESDGDGQPCLVLGAHEGRFGKADIEHADPAAIGIEDRLIGRDIPVVDDEGAVAPRPALIEHGAADFLGDARADGAPVAEQANIGADADIVEEKRRGALDAIRLAGSMIDEIVDRIDEIEIPIEQDAADQRRAAAIRQENGGGGMQHETPRLDHAAGRIAFSRRHDLDARPFGEARRDGGQFRIREDVDAGLRAA